MMQCSQELLHASKQTLDNTCILYRVTDDGAPWHKGLLQGAEKFMASWHKEEEEASRRRATKRDSRDLEAPPHICR